MNTELMEALTILEKEKNISKDVMMQFEVCCVNLGILRMI